MLERAACLEEDQARLGDRDDTVGFFPRESLFQERKPLAKTVKWICCCSSVLTELVQQLLSVELKIEDRKLLTTFKSTDMSCVERATQSAIAGIVSLLQATSSFLCGGTLSIFALGSLQFTMLSFFQCLLGLETVLVRG